MCFKQVYCIGQRFRSHFGFKSAPPQGTRALRCRCAVPSATMGDFSPAGGDLGACEGQGESDDEDLARDLDRNAALVDGLSCRRAQAPPPKRRLSDLQREAFAELGIAPAGTRDRRAILADARQAKRKRCAERHVVASLRSDGEALAEAVAGLPSVPDADMDRILLSRQQAQVLANRPLLTEVIEKALDNAAHVEVSEDIGKAVALLCGGEGHVHSNRELAEKLGIARAGVQPLTQLVASSLTGVDACFRYKLDRAIAEQCRLDGSWKPLMFMECMRYDETPMQLVMRHMAFSRSKANPHPAQIDDSGLELIASHTLAKECAPSKLFQTEARFAWLLQHTSAEGERTFRMVRGSALNGVQVLESTSNEVLMSALCETSLATRHAEQCRLQVRATTTDKFGANFLAEKRILSERGPSWVGIHLPCDVHCLATCQGKAFALQSAAWSGMVNLALSIVQAGLMRRWRRCIQEDISERVEVRVGALCSAEAIAYKQHCLSLFMSRGRNIAERRVLARLMPNGDWREFDKIPIHVAPDPGGRDPDRRAIVQGVQGMFLKAFASHGLPIYRRDRWTGADLCLDELGVMMCCNGLLYHSYIKFVSRLGPARDLGCKGVVLPVAPQSEVDERPPLADAAPDAEGKAAAAAEASQEGPPQEAQAIDEEETWEQKHARFRRLGLAFVVQRPVAIMMVLRAAMEPFRSYMAKLLKVGAHRWEQRERAKEAKAIAGAAAGRQLADVAAMAYRVTLAAEGTLEDDCLDQLRSLLGSDAMWRHLPPGSWTIDARHEIFKLLSRSMCAVEELIRQPHSVYPIRVFLCLVDKTFTEVVSSEPECVLDQFTLEWRELFREEGLDSDAALMCLRVAAQMLYTDIASIECLHASMRRILRGKVQTHQLSSSDLSVEWLCARFRSRQKHAGRAASAVAPRRPHKAKRARHKRGPPGRKKPRPPRGGAWRAFVSQQCKFKQGQANFRQLAALYAELPAVEKARLKEVGRAAHASAQRLHSKGSAFGRLARQVAQQAAKRRRLALMPGPQGLAGPGSVALCSASGTTFGELAPISAGNGEVKGHIAAARQEQRLVSARCSLDDANVAKQVQAFREGVGKRSLDSFCEQAPGLREVLTHVQPIPDRCLQAFDFAPDAASWAAGLASRARAESTSSNLCNALRMLWQYRSLTITHQDKPKLVDLESPDEKRAAARRDKCRAEGTCLCCKEGRQIMHIEGAYLAVLRRFFGVGKAQRQDIVSGAIVVRFCFPDLLDEWYHIGMHYLSPLRSTFLALELVCNLAELRPDEPVQLQVPMAEFNFEFVKCRVGVGRLAGQPKLLSPVWCSNGACICFARCVPSRLFACALNGHVYSCRCGMGVCMVMRFHCAGQPCDYTTVVVIVPCLC
jgi:hypothetical protein